jgi:hypothetical protein
MAGVQTSEMDAKFPPANVRTWRVKFCDHENHTILVRQVNPYLCNNGSHSLAYCFTTVTMVVKVTMETNVRILQSLNYISDRALLNNVK